MIKPKSLKKGDKVAIVSLSSGMMGEKNFIHKYYLAKERLETIFGLKVVSMPNALKGINYLYRHPEARARDLMDAFKDKEIKAIFNAIGGDDTIRLLPFIDFDVIRNNPKIFTGFSDTTTNHFMMYKAGLVSYYGLSVMNHLAEYVNINEYTRSYINNFLFSPSNHYNIEPSSFCSYENDKIWWMEENINKCTPRFDNDKYIVVQGHGVVEGKLLGGCIDVFLELIGTPLWPSLEEWNDKILLIETSEANMPELVFCWLLRNLQAQGILHKLKGIIVGKPAYKDKMEPYIKVLKTVVGDEAKLPQLPILFNVNIGHSYPSAILPLGLKYEINCENRTLKLVEPATEY